MKREGRNKDTIEKMTDKPNCQPNYLIQGFMDIEAAHRRLPRESLEKIAERPGAFGPLSLISAIHLFPFAPLVSSIRVMSVKT
ncbi:MAG: hypothetical protein V1897_19040 [Pseudomonadota bacterium]